MIDLGMGGFMVLSAAPFPIGVVREFRFTAGVDGWTTILRARVAYSHRRVTPDDQPVEYASGFAFAESHDAAIERQIDGLLARATGLLTFPG